MHDITVKFQEHIYKTKIFPGYLIQNYFCFSCSRDLGCGSGVFGWLFLPHFLASALWTWTALQRVWYENTICSPRSPTSRPLVTSLSVQALLRSTPAGEDATLVRSEPNICFPITMRFQRGYKHCSLWKKTFLIWNKI